jgi:hypothetical protein
VLTIGPTFALLVRSICHPFRANRYGRLFPWLKPWAESSSPFGARPFGPSIRAWLLSACLPGQKPVAHSREGSAYGVEPLSASSKSAERLDRLEGGCPGGLNKTYMYNYTCGGRSRCVAIGSCPNPLDHLYAEATETIRKEYWRSSASMRLYQTRPPNIHKLA